MDTAHRDTAAERLASMLNISVEDLNSSLQPNDELPTTPHIVVEYFPQLPERVATDEYWHVRGSQLVDKFLQEQWKSQTQTCSNIRFEPVLDTDTWSYDDELRRIRVMLHPV